MGPEVPFGLLELTWPMELDEFMPFRWASYGWCLCFVVLIFMPIECEIAPVEWSNDGEGPLRPEDGSGAKLAGEYWCMGEDNIIEVQTWGGGKRKSSKKLVTKDRAMDADG
jgi:hypothetical protein